MSEPRKGLLPAEGGGWWLLVDKPAGPTSHDLVDLVRRAAGQPKLKVGHAGTLDPAATGLMVLAIGKATKRLAEGLEGGKRYQASAQLGLLSPTDDLDAPWTLSVETPPLERARVERAVRLVANAPTQRPPMMSAIKREGIKIHRLARVGWDMEIEQRPVELNELQLLEHDEPSGQFRLDIAGGGGLYVRALVHDIGLALGLPAALTGLRRTRLGPWTVEQALSPDDVARMEIPAS